MSNKVFYGLGLVMSFILGYFVIGMLDNDEGNVSSETYDFSDSSIYNSILNNKDTLEDKVSILNNMTNSRYDEATLESFKEYFTKYNTYVSELEIVSYTGVETFSVEEIEEILVDLVVADYTATGKIDIYSTAISHYPNKDELIDIYANKQASYLYINDPGVVSILVAEQVKFVNKDNDFPNIYMHYILGCLDLQLVEHIELLNIIIN